MATCKDCLHVEACSSILSGFDVDIEFFSKQISVCKNFKDRYRFVELPKARWLRHSPDKIIMREFHKQGIGRGMDENSIFWTCSKCELWVSLAYNFCPNCGAKFEAEQALKERIENDA